MKDFERLLNNLNKLDIDDIFFKLWSNNKVQKYIIRLLTEGEPTSQLYELGEDGNGLFLGEYTETSKFLKLKGDGDKRIDHITLKDSGGYYKTYVVIPNKKGFKTDSDPLLDDGTNLEDRFGNNLDKINEDNTELLLAFIEEDFERELEKRLFQ